MKLRKNQLSRLRAIARGFYESTYCRDPLVIRGYAVKAPEGEGGYFGAAVPLRITDAGRAALEALKCES